MKFVLFAVKDLAVQSFQPVQNIAHFGGARRWFQDQVNNKETNFGQHPEDYELHEIGTFDTETGCLVECRGAVIRGKDLLNSVG